MRRPGEAPGAPFWQVSIARIRLLFALALSLALPLVLALGLILTLVLALAAVFVAAFRSDSSLVRLFLQRVVLLPCGINRLLLGVEIGFEFCVVVLPLRRVPQTSGWVAIHFGSSQTIFTLRDIEFMT